VFNEAILASNLAALARAQGQPPVFAALAPERVRAVADAAAGLRLELKTASGAWLPLDGPAATEFPRQLFVIGPALGTMFDAIEGAGAPTRVVALEPDPGVAVLMLARRDWTRWIDQGRLRLLTGPDYTGAASCGRHVDVSTPPMVLVSPQLADHRPAEVAAARAVASRIISAAQSNADARKRFAGRYLLQSLANLPVVAREGNTAALDGLFTGRPAVVVGAGPSLDRNLPALAALQDRAVIIGVDTTLRPLLAGGVRPHIMAGVDPGEMNARHLAGVSGLDDVWLAAEGSLHPSAFEGFAGRTFVFKVSNHEPWPWLGTLGLDRGTLRAWGSVVTSAFDLALRMGCNPIVFAGLDLSYPVRRPYCAGTIFDQIWRDAMATYRCTRDQLVDDYFSRIGDLRLPDVHGRPILTTRTLVAFRDWLREQIAADGSRRFVNATGAGLLHGPRLEQAPLESVLDGAPLIDQEVRARLRAAHARSIVAASALGAAVENLAADPSRQKAASLIARWIDFTAGTVTDGDIRDQLALALPSLAP
jgi:hypothetical protein